MNLEKNAELQRRRKLRLEQVRQQSKDIAQDLRNRIAAEKKRKDIELAKAKCKELKEWQDGKLKELQDQYAQSLCEMGIAHKEAALQPDPVTVLQEKKKCQDTIGKLRGLEAKKLAKENASKKFGKLPKKNSFRSVVIATPRKGKIKITQTISGLDARKNKNLCSLKANVATQSEPECSETSNIEQFGKTSSLRARTVEQKGELPVVTEFSDQNSDKSSKNEIYENFDDSKSWICPCCRNMNKKGSCFDKCICTRPGTSSYPRANTIETDVSPINGHINSKLLSDKGTDVFTQVSDRIKSRNLSQAPCSPSKSTKSKVSYTEKLYNPDLFVSHSSEPNEGQASRDLSSLSEVSEKIRSSVRNAKKHLDDIEPEVVELQKNVKSFSRDRSKERPQSKVKISKVKSPAKSEKIKFNTSKTASGSGISKIKMYDTDARYVKEYEAPSNLVEKIDVDVVSAHELALRERRKLDKENWIQAQRRKADLEKSKLRGQRALHEERAVRNLDDISDTLGILAQRENSAKISKDHGLQTASQLKELERQQHEAINKAFENAFVEDDIKIPSNVITLKRINRTKGKKGKENVEKTTTTIIQKETEFPGKHSRLNVGNWDIPSSSHMFIPKTSSELDKDSSSSSSILIREFDERMKPMENPLDIMAQQALQISLDRVNLQKQMLMEEVAKNDLPQNSKLADVLDAVERSLLNSAHITEKDMDDMKSNSMKNEDNPQLDLAEVRNLKKQKKKLAKKEEELKFKELQLELLMQKHKVTELESRQKSEADAEKSPKKEPMKNNTLPDIRNVEVMEAEQQKELPLKEHKVPKILLPDSSSSDNGVEIVIKVKDNAKKKTSQSPRKFSVRAKGPSVIQKYRKTGAQFKSSHREPGKAKTRSKRINANSSTSSTSYMSPPKELNIPKTFADELTNLAQLYQTKTQSNVAEMRQFSPPISQRSQKYEQTRLNIGDQKLENDYERFNNKVENPQLLKYINRLLSMDRSSIDALAVSSCSEVPTPSNSIIDIPSNKINTFHETTTSPNEEHINNIKEFIDRNYNFLKELESTVHPEKSSIIDHVDEVPSKLKSKDKIMYSTKGAKSPHKATQTSFPKEITKVNSVGIQTPDESGNIFKAQKDFQDVDDSFSHLDMQTEETQKLADSCNKRISNLADLISKVRQEKLRLLESSLSSSSSLGKNSTEYLELPSHIQEQAEKSGPTKENDLQNSMIKSSKTIERNIFEESRPQFDISTQLDLAQIEQSFIPMLKDIPKPFSEVKQDLLRQEDISIKTIKTPSHNLGDSQVPVGLEHEIIDIKQNMVGLNKQLSNLENYMGQIQEYIGDANAVVGHKQKPPVSLRQIAQLRNNINLDVGAAHELSAIIEVETPAVTRISESNLEISTISEDIYPGFEEKSVEQAGVTFMKNQTHSDGQKVAQDAKRSLKFVELSKHIFNENALNITLKSPSKQDGKSLDKLIKTELNIKPFPTFEEYAKKLDGNNIADSKSSNISHYAVNDDFIDKTSNPNEETLPDVMSELMRRNVLQEPFNNDSQNIDTSKNYSKTISGMSLMSDSSVENSSSVSSTISPDFEKALQKLGLNWALSTLKKTQESMALSSSSSMEYPSPDTNYLTKRIMALKKLNEESLKELKSIGQPLPDKVVIESSYTESDGLVKNITQKTEFQDVSSNSNEKSKKSSNLKSFLAQELAKKNRTVSLDKEAIFRTLLSGSKDISDLNITYVPTSQTNQRTSTPVLGERKTSSGSRSNSIYDTLFSGSNLSSVKNYSSENQNSSISGEPVIISKLAKNTTHISSKLKHTK